MALGTLMSANEHFEMMEHFRDRSLHTKRMNKLTRHMAADMTSGAEADENGQGHGRQRLGSLTED
jgi:hypothetical protein